MRLSVITITAIGWFVATAFYGYYYVASRICLPDAEGYEKLWDWQLFFFFITRFPLLLVLLGAIIILEFKLVPEGKHVP
jgi:hypothetical protein